MDKTSIIIGRNAVVEAFVTGVPIQKVFISTSVEQEFANTIYNYCKSQDCPLARVPKQKLDQMTRAVHQGVIAQRSAVEFWKVEELVNRVFEKGETPRILVLDGVTDVRNFGAIARSAEVFGIHGLVIGHTDAAPINDISVKASAGALNRIPVCREKSLKTALQTLTNFGFAIYGASEKAAEPVSKIFTKDPTAVIMGSEGEGISTELLRQCTKQFTIPQVGKMDSLNVSVAAGIICYEWSKVG